MPKHRLRESSQRLPGPQLDVFEQFLASGFGKESRREAPNGSVSIRYRLVSLAVADTFEADRCQRDRLPCTRAADRHPLIEEIVHATRERRFDTVGEHASPDRVGFAVELAQIFQVPAASIEDPEGVAHYVEGQHVVKVFGVVELLQGLGHSRVRAHRQPTSTSSVPSGSKRIRNRRPPRRNARFVRPPSTAKSRMSRSLKRCTSNRYVPNACGARNPCDTAWSNSNSPRSTRRHTSCPVSSVAVSSSAAGRCSR